MPTTIALPTTSRKYVGFAKAKLKQLKKRLARRGRDRGFRFFQVDTGEVIEVRANETGNDLIRIRNMGLEDAFVLAPADHPEYLGIQAIFNYLHEWLAEIGSGATYSLKRGQSLPPLIVRGKPRYKMIYLANTDLAFNPEKLAEFTRLGGTVYSTRTDHDDLMNDYFAAIPYDYSTDTSYGTPLPGLWFAGNSPATGLNLKASRSLSPDDAYYAVTLPGNGPFDRRVVLARLWSNIFLCTDDGWVTRPQNIPFISNLFFYSLHGSNFNFNTTVPAFYIKAHYNEHYSIRISNNTVDGTPASSYFMSRSSAHRERELEKFRTSWLNKYLKNRMPGAEPNSGDLYRPIPYDSPPAFVFTGAPTIQVFREGLVLNLLIKYQRISNGKLKDGESTSTWTEPVESTSSGSPTYCWDRASPDPPLGSGGGWGGMSSSGSYSNKLMQRPTLSNEFTYSVCSGSGQGHHYIMWTGNQGGSWGGPCAENKSEQSCSEGRLGWFERWESIQRTYPAGKNNQSKIDAWWAKYN
jgi:hypothetical protein